MNINHILLDDNDRADLKLTVTSAHTCKIILLSFKLAQAGVGIHNVGVFQFYSKRFS